jgi:hypothetical protein
MKQQTPYQKICKHKLHKPYTNQDMKKCSLCDMEIGKIINTQEEARQYAIDWQNWVSEQNTTENPQSLYQSELVEWQEIFSELGERFDLTEEFQENGII